MKSFLLSQVAAGQVMSQLTNEADVQLAEVLVAVSDALVAANQEQAAGEHVQLVHTTPSVHQDDAGNNVHIMETGEEQGIETDMNADQTVPIIASGEAESSHVCQVLFAQKHRS